MRFSTDMTHFVTASNDKTARLIDSRTFQVLKIYKTGFPVNAVDMSPIHDHVIFLSRDGMRLDGRSCLEGDRRLWTWLPRDLEEGFLSLDSITRSGFVTAGSIRPS